MAVSAPSPALPSKLRGAVCGLLGAALFGLSAPLTKSLLATLAPQLLAGLLYLGAAAGLWLWRLLRPRSGEAPLRRADLPALLGVVLCGGMAGPLLMLVGLVRVSAVTGSLLLNLEGPLTMLLAVALFREHLGRSGALAALLILGGAATMKLDLDPRALTMTSDLPGMLCIAAACLCWAIDNNLTQRLSLRDPFAVVRIKTLAAGAGNLGLWFLLRGAAPLPVLPASTLAAALGVGALSYGVSVVLDAYALRDLGAAREAAYFATAPFIGALAALLLLHEPLQRQDVLAMTLMALGVLLLLRERHSHPHVHEAQDHDHLHHHDAHHQHPHGPSTPPGEPHAHPHHHGPLTHEHPHASDLHHRHAH